MVVEEYVREHKEKLLEELVFDKGYVLHPTIGWFCVTEACRDQGLTVRYRQGLPVEFVDANENTYPADWQNIMSIIHNQNYGITPAGSVESFTGFINEVFTYFGKFVGKSCEDIDEFRQVRKAYDMRAEAVSEGFRLLVRESLGYFGDGVLASAENKTDGELQDSGLADLTINQTSFEQRYLDAVKLEEYEQLDEIRDVALGTYTVLLMKEKGFALDFDPTKNRLVRYIGQKPQNFLGEAQKHWPRIAMRGEESSTQSLYNHD